MGVWWESSGAQGVFGFVEERRFQRRVTRSNRLREPEGPLFHETTFWQRRCLLTKDEASQLVAQIFNLFWITCGAETLRQLKECLL
jgi:hypothetical protein